MACFLRSRIWRVLTTVVTMNNWNSTTDQSSLSKPVLGYKNSDGCLNYKLFSSARKDLEWWIGIGCSRTWGLKRVISNELIKVNSECEVQKKYSRKGKLNEKNSCTPINPKTYSFYGLRKIHTRNLIKKKKFLRLKNSPPPPITFLMVRPLGFFIINHLAR